MNWFYTANVTQGKNTCRRTHTQCKRKSYNLYDLVCQEFYCQNYTTSWDHFRKREREKKKKKINVSPLTMPHNINGLGLYHLSFVSLYLSKISMPLWPSYHSVLWLPALQHTRSPQAGTKGFDCSQWKSVYKSSLKIDFTLNTVNAQKFLLSVEKLFNMLFKPLLDIC